jgi:hypothetical protein
MPKFYRSEVRAKVSSSGSIERTPSFVVLVEIPEEVIRELGGSSPRLQTKAYEIALDATQKQRLNDPSFRYIEWSNTESLDTNPEELGVADLTAEDGCRAWILQAPEKD